MELYQTPEPGKYNPNYNAIFRYFFSKIDHKMDLMNFFNMQDDILKLQKLLLNEDQMNIFQLWDFNYQVAGENILCENFQEKNRNEIVNSFMKLNWKAEKSSIDKQLLKEIGI